MNLGQSQYHRIKITKQFITLIYFATFFIGFERRKTSFFEYFNGEIDFFEDVMEI